MELVAKKTFGYGGRRIKAGDTFTASARDARTLKIIGSAEDAPAESTEKPAKVETRALQGDGKQKRKYIRRDLTAEE